jgi:Uma2 family endonuclease
MTAARTLKTLADLHPDDRAELIDGTILEKAAPLLGHGVAQLGVGTWVGTHFRGGPPEGGTPGWWFGTEVHVQIAPGRVVCPDIAGWRKDRHPTLFSRATEWPVHELPDWICEVLSESNASHDLGTKVGLYAQACIAHYWVLDPALRRLLVYRWTERGYLVVVNATGEATVRAEPFDSIEVKVVELLGQQ